MRLPRETYQIRQTIETHLSHLSQPQLTGLVLWVCGAILAGSACQNAVASALSPWHKWNNLRQYLREWLYDGGDRKSPCQTQLLVSFVSMPVSDRGNQPCRYITHTVESQSRHIFSVEITM